MPNLWHKKCAQENRLGDASISLQIGWAHAQVEIPGALLNMGYYTEKYGDDIAAFGMGIMMNTPHGRKAVKELVKAAVIYRADQVKILGRFAVSEAGFRAGALRGPAKSLAMGTARGVMRVAKHPAVLVGTGAYIAGTAVGNTHVVQTRGDPNPLLMGVF